jgi:hypothetical protein
MYSASIFSMTHNWRASLLTLSSTVAGIIPAGPAAVHPRCVWSVQHHQAGVHHPGVGSPVGDITQLGTDVRGPACKHWCLLLCLLEVTAPQQPQQ